jgi:sensor histidine kinase YesM
MNAYHLKRGRKTLKWLGINLIIGILVPLLYTKANYFSIEGLLQIWDDMLYSFMMSIGISSAVGLNEIILDKHFPWLEHAGKRLFFEIIGVSILGFAAVYIMNVFFYTAFGRINYAEFPWKRMAEYSIWPLLVGYVITTFFISKGFLNKAKEEAIKSEKLQTEKYRSEVRALKDQLNPHFLFNALNVLTNLVYEDADKSADYIRNLSRFYRYVLEIQDEDVIGLNKELKFARDYLQLQQERFGQDALQIEEIRSDSENLSLPPLALQLLLENVLKHNRCSSIEPLRISIIHDGQYLEVKNNLQSRSSAADHLGIGLSNLQKRYKLLGFETPEILNDGLTFSVKLRLIPSK